MGKNEFIKQREIIVSMPPDWDSKKIIKEIKITKIVQPFEIYDDYIIEYDGSTSKVFQQWQPPTDNEIEAFCVGVESERERFKDILYDYLDEDIIKKIINKI